MKFLRNIAAMALLGAAISASAQDPWLHLYYNNVGQYRAYDMTEVLDITFDENAGTMTVNLTGLDGKPVTISAADLQKFEIGANVAELRITTDDFYTEVPSKEYYVSGNIQFLGRGLADSFESPMQIRGRGNSTWGHTKKPYRIKYAEKTRMLLPKKAKNFVLLANALDPSMMRNFVAFTFGKYIEMPYINHSEPVDVYFNEYYKGAYQLTEKCGFNNGSVDLSKEDEPNSIMFELDTYTPSEDEHPFTSESFDSYYYYGLPVRVKDPDAPEDYEAMLDWEWKWQEDFNQFMNVIATGDVDKIYEACDLESLVRFVMVNNIACNQELDHPKSVYLWKTEGGKYNFGPCWDFDWAFGYQPTYKKGQTNTGGWGGGGGWGTSYPSYENPLLAKGRNEGHGGEFFYALCGNDRFKKRFREVWDDFYKNHLDEFWADFDAYAERLRPSAYKQGTASYTYQGFENNVKSLRDWVAGRIEYINDDDNMALWEDGMFD